MRVVFSLFIALHGLVHLWFVVLNQKLIPFEEKMGWTGQSWLLSNLLPEPTLKILATSLLILSTVMFVAGGVMFGFRIDYAKEILILSSIVSSLTLIIFWDGSFNMIVEKGLIGLIINIATLLYFIFI